MSTVPVIHTLGAAAPDVTSNVNLLDLLGDSPLPAKVAVLLGVLVPVVSAYLTRRPSFVTGVLSVLVSFVVSIVSTWIAQGTTFSLSDAIATALPTFGVAVLAQISLYRNTGLAKWLYEHGIHGSDVDTSQLPPYDPTWDQPAGDVAADPLPGAVDTGVEEDDLAEPFTQAELEADGIVDDNPNDLPDRG